MEQLNSKEYVNSLLDSDRFVKVIHLVDLKRKVVSIFKDEINGLLLCEKSISDIEIYNRYKEELSKEQIKNLFYKN